MLPVPVITNIIMRTVVSTVTSCVVREAFYRLTHRKENKEKRIQKSKRILTREERLQGADRDVLDWLRKAS